MSFFLQFTHFCDSLIVEQSGNSERFYFYLAAGKLSYTKGNQVLFLSQDNRDVGKMIMSEASKNMLHCICNFLIHKLPHTWHYKQIMNNAGAKNMNIGHNKYDDYLISFNSWITPQRQMQILQIYLSAAFTLYLFYKPVLIFWFQVNRPSKCCCLASFKTTLQPFHSEEEDWSKLGGGGIGK